jgi:hypothetical protein
MNDKNETVARPEKTGGVKTPKVQWDDSQMSTSYANVVNAVSSREEFTLFFGTNQTWNAQDAEYRVKLSDRVILNPHAAKRLLTLLAAVMKEYEKRFGAVNIDLSSQTPTAGRSTDGGT